MGLLDSLITGAVGQMLGGGNKANLINMVLGMLQGQQGGQGGGGLGSIVEQFTKAGFGQQAQSWVGTGANLPISPEDLMKVFGQGQMQQFGQQLGVNPQEAAGGLSSILPEIINQLTPQGQVTQGNEFETLLGALKGRL
jgi:uncharacterized protein YidB (DUF937 family)